MSVLLTRMHKILTEPETDAEELLIFNNNNKDSLSEIKDNC